MTAGITACALIQTMPKSIPTSEGVPLALRQPPQKPPRRPVVGDAGMVERKDAHRLTLGTAACRRDWFSAPAGGYAALASWALTQAWGTGV